MGLILLIIVILMLVGAFPAWPHSRNWGYGPSGGFGLLLLILIIMLNEAAIAEKYSRTIKLRSIISSPPPAMEF
jgi:uncharacterized membrane protein